MKKKLREFWLFQKSSKWSFDKFPDLIYDDLVPKIVGTSFWKPDFFWIFSSSKKAIAMTPNGVVEDHKFNNCGWWMVDDGWWMMDDGWWMLNYGCWIVDAELWMPNCGCWIMDAEFWMLNCGCWIMIPSLKSVSGKRLLEKFWKQK